MTALDTARFEAVADAFGFGDIVGTSDTAGFPDELTPTGAVLTDDQVRFTWHVRADLERRAGDLYRYRAYRVVPERHTVRLVMQRHSGYIGTFISVPKKSTVDPAPVADTAAEIITQLLDGDDESRFVLSNNHVLADSNTGERGDPILQPGPIDGGDPDEPFATLERYVEIDLDGDNLVDAAVARRPVGLLFAGGGGTTFINPIDLVLDALDAQIVTS